MAEDTQNGAAGATPETPAGPSFSVEKIYVKDVSFEVVLGVTLTCNANDKPLYLAEVQQAGLFNLRGFEAQTLDAMLGIQCPHVLYPYARQLVSDLVQAGGFPAFYLQPINFEGLYAEGLRQRAAQGQQSGEGLAGPETAGNA